MNCFIAAQMKNRITGTRDARNNTGNDPTASSLVVQKTSDPNARMNNSRKRRTVRVHTKRGMEQKHIMDQNTNTLKPMMPSNATCRTKEDCHGVSEHFIGDRTTWLEINENDAAEENIRQSRLYSQLADISYRAVHGKRQTTRDFTKGMLNVGKLGEQMEVPEDEITKDMILDYKREQEEKLYDGDKRYQSTGLPDNLQEYVPLFVNDDVDLERQKYRLRIHNERRRNLINQKKIIEEKIIDLQKQLEIKINN